MGSLMPGYLGATPIHCLGRLRHNTVWWWLCTQSAANPSLKAIP